MDAGTHGANQCWKPVHQDYRNAHAIYSTNFPWQPRRETANAEIWDYARGSHKFRRKVKQQQQNTRTYARTRTRTHTHTHTLPQWSLLASLISIFTLLLLIAFFSFSFIALFSALEQTLCCCYCVFCFLFKKKHSFHSPLNCDMDHRIFNMHVIPFNMCYIHSVDPDLYSHPKDLSQCTVCGLCAI